MASCQHVPAFQYRIRARGQLSYDKSKGAYDEDIESSIQYSRNSTLPYDRPISLSKVVNQHTQV